MKKIVIVALFFILSDLNGVRRIGMEEGPRTVLVKLVNDLPGRYTPSELLLQGFVCLGFSVPSALLWWWVAKGGRGDDQGFVFMTGFTTLSCVLFGLERFEKWLNYPIYEREFNLMVGLTQNMQRLLYDDGRVWEVVRPAHNAYYLYCDGDSTVNKFEVQRLLKDANINRVHISSCKKELKEFFTKARADRVNYPDKQFKELEGKLFKFLNFSDECLCGEVSLRH